ncbi:Phosphoglycerol transferase MdoB [Allopseudospirillum japonicum]|uniref:Phosphoglycerol transferase MdoB n=1 Tax=Allopseudospirillum japonicum TaxID=64971 RepID=A0A1H6R7N8_9GAMM|nr:LTA synthase family protein [Allopseudospirillum japonicum]SEI47655.1 Phosphoglycerol transferase MdoB [Allopseudospirillum japonicum]
MQSRRHPAIGYSLDTPRAHMPWWRFSVLGPFAPVAAFFLLALVLLSCMRLGLVIWQWPRVDAVDGLGFVLLQGIRVDLILLCYLALIPTLLSPFFYLNRNLQSLGNYLFAGWFSLALVVIVFLELATPSFIEQYDARPDRLFVEYLNYPHEVFATLWEAYRLTLISTLLLSCALAVFVYRFFSQYRKINNTWHPLIGLCMLVLILPIMVLGARSSLQHRPANPSLFAFSTDNLVNKLVLNSTYSVLYALYSLKDEATSSEIYGQMATEEMLTRVRQTSLLPLTAFQHPALPTLHEQSPSYLRERPLNLVIILEESLGAGFVAPLGGEAITPNLARLAQQGFWMQRMYATGTRSVRGIEAVVSGFLPTPARSVVKLSGSQHGFFTLADLLNQQGYHTEFIYGGESHFDNMRGFFLGNGFQKVIDQKDYQAPNFVGSWGVSDEDLMAKAHTRFSELHAQGQAFFGLVFSSSNHSPFEYPEGRIQATEPKQSVENAVRYADYALGEFFKAAQQSAYWQDTLFLVVADHDTRVYGSDLVPIDKFHIPALILGADIPAEVYAGVASQIDLAPTLLSMMGIEAQHPMLGRDLTRTPLDQGRALMQFQDIYAYMHQDQVVVLQQGQTPKYFMYQAAQKSLQPSELAWPDLARTALAHALVPAWLYQEKLYRLPE